VEPQWSIPLSQKEKQFVELGVSILTFQALKNSDIVVTPSHGLKKAVENIAPNKSIYVNSKQSGRRAV